MKKISALTSIIFIFGLSLLFANGGAVVSSEGFKSSGNITLIQTKDISLVKEYLYITLKPGIVDVNVIYHLDNRNKEQIVMYGFPFKADNASHENTGSQELDAWIPEYKISVNDMQIPYSKRFDQIFHRIKENVKDVETVRWHLSDLPLKKGLNIIEVHYSVKPYKMNSKYFRPLFEYDFKPAATWGNGKVKELKITFDRSHINQPGVKVYFRGLIKDYDNNQTQDKIIEERSDVDLFTLKNIAAYYNYDEFNFNRDFPFNKNKAKNMVKKITVSSTLSDKYSKENLIDGDFNTSWVEGKKDSGVGEWVEVEFNDKGKGLPHFVGIVNGYYQNQELYYANNRIKSLKVTITQQWSITDMETDKAQLSEYTFDKIVDLPDMPYVKPDLRNSSKYLSIFEYYSDGANGVSIIGIKKIRFEILSVYPGNKYNDTCIAELLAFPEKNN